MKSLIEYINESNNIELVSDGNEHGFEYVDLGLPSGTMWATCNVGGNKPEDPGLLFQFGHIDGYAYNDNNNQFRTNYQNKQDTGNERISKTTTGKLYDKNDILDLDDDAVHVNMGGKWKMPTNEQLEELSYNTTHEVKTINNKPGMLFTSTKPGYEGKQVFIPFAGYWYNGSFYKKGSYTYVWSSQVHPSYVNIAYRLFCDSSANTNIGDGIRSYAFSVRGVFKK